MIITNTINLIRRTNSKFEWIKFSRIKKHDENTTKLNTTKEEFCIFRCLWISMFVYELNKYNLRAPQNLWFTLRALFEAHKVECYDNVYSLVFTKVVIFHYDYFYILTLVQLILHIWLIGHKFIETNKHQFRIEFFHC